MYLFPIDEMATLVDFSVKVGGQLLRGRVVEQLDTSARYEEVVARGSAASILENLQADVYAIQVGEVPASTEVEVVVVYNTLLPMDGQSLCYLLPMALAPRPITVGAGEAAKAQDGLSDIDRMLKARRENQKNNLRIEVRCRMSNTVKEIRCPTHDKVNIQLSHQRVPTVELIQDQPYLDKDFVLLIKTENAYEPRAMVEVNEVGEQSSCAAVAYNLPLPATLPKSEHCDLVLIVQHGPSMARQAAQAVDFLQKAFVLLPDLCKLATFNVGCFGSDSRLLWKASQPFCAESVQKAQQFIASHLAEAAAAPDAGCAFTADELHVPQASHRALLSLLRTVVQEPPAAPSTTRQFLILSNGNIRDRHGHLAKDVVDVVQGARVFTVGLGYAVTRRLLTAIAKETGAAFFSILPHIQGSGAIKTCLFNAVSEPSHATVLWEFPDSEPVLAEASETSKQVPFRPRPIFYGQPSVVYNLPNAGSRPIKNVILIASRTPGGPEEETVMHGWPQHGSQGLLLQRIAAQTLIHELEEGESYLQQLGAPSDEEVKQTILDLALKYHLHSPYTTWEVASSTAPAKAPGRVDRDGSSNPSIKAPMKTVSKLRLVASADQGEDALDLGRPLTATAVEFAVPGFKAQEQELPKAPPAAAAAAAAAAPPPPLSGGDSRRKQLADDEAEAEARLQKARQREMEAAQKAREAEVQQQALVREAEEQRRTELQRQARETRKAAEELAAKRHNAEKAAAVARLDEERRVAEEHLAASRDRRSREIAKMREDEAAEQRRRDEERERGLQALVDERRRQEDEEEAARDRAFQAQRDSMKRATLERADDALRATEEQIQQDVRRRAAERERSRLRHEEEARQARLEADALRTSTVRSTISTTTLSAFPAAAARATWQSERSESRDALFDWKLDATRAQSQRHLQSEFDLHEQQLTRKIHEFDEETRRLRRELLTDLPGLRGE